MLLLYTRLYGRQLTQAESVSRRHQSSLRPSETELEQESSRQLRHTNVAEPIRHLRKVYHLERSFLL